MNRYIRVSVTGMMMVHFGWQAVISIISGQIISGIFLVVMTLCWAAAWRKKSIRLAIIEFIGN